MIFEGIVLVFLLVIPMYITYLIFHLRLNESFLNFGHNLTGRQLMTTLILAVILWGSPFFIAKWGSSDINSFFAKNLINFKGYVYAFPNESNAKNYRLKADMVKDGNAYGILAIYFNNGGYIDFDWDTERDSLSKNGEIICKKDENDKEWCFRFYGEQIKSNDE